MNLVDVARAGESLAAAADAQTRLLVDGFVHQAGPPPSRFAWVAMGSHARGELHCASDQDHALFWERTPSGSYATDLAQTVIAGLEEFGMRRCDGGYMADTWSYSVDDWAEILRDRVNEPTPDAIVDAEVFLDMRPLTSGLRSASTNSRPTPRACCTDSRSRRTRSPPRCTRSAGCPRASWT